MTDDISVEGAIERGDYDEAQRMMTIRLARAFDGTTSARDLKALARELRLNMVAMQQIEQANADTPLAQIMQMVDEA